MARRVGNTLHKGKEKSVGYTSKVKAILIFVSQGLLNCISTIYSGKLFLHVITWRSHFMENLIDIMVNIY